MLSGLLRMRLPLSIIRVARWVRKKPDTHFLSSPSNPFPLLPYFPLPLKLCPIKSSYKVWERAASSSGGTWD